MTTLNMRIYQIVITEILCYETLKVTNKSSECKANGLIYEKWDCELISSKSNFFLLIWFRIL